MPDAEGISTQISKSLSLRWKKEQEYRNVIDNASLKDHILLLKLGLPCLQRLLSVSNNEDLKMLVRDVIIHPITEEYDVILSEPFSWKGNLRKIDEFLLKISEDVSRYLADHIAHLVKEIEDFKEKLLILKSLLTYVSNTEVDITEGNEKSLTPLVAWLDKLACLFYSCLVVKMDEEMTLELKHTLPGLLRKIDMKEIFVVILGPPKLYISEDKYLRSELDPLNILISRLNSVARSGIYMNEPSKELVQRLEFVKDFLLGLSDEQLVERFSYLVATIEDIILKSIPILCSCYDKDMGDDMAEEINGKLCEVLGLIENIQADVKEIKLHNYPKIDGLGFLEFFLEHLKELLEHRPSIEIPRSQIEELHLELSSLTEKIREPHNGHEKLGDVWTHIIGLAYQAEYVIDLCLVKHDPDPRIMFSLPKITEQIQIYSSDVTRIYQEEKDHSQAHNTTETFIPDSLRAIDTTHEVVGFDHDLETIKKYLFEGEEQLDVISIVGMAGAGKTTLAMEIFKHSKDVRGFDVQARCTISQVYRRRRVLVAIFRGIFEKDPSQIEKLENELDDEVLLDELRRSLSERRYFIVMDDMWDIEVWKELSVFLPDDENGSRIIITSRLQIVDPENRPGCKVHSLQPLSEDDSWRLFRTRLPQIECFSEDFLQTGEKISRRCMGLPLSIVVIAGLLANVGKNIDKWHQIEESLSSHVLNDSQTRCKAILELSYSNLPDHLKSFFLYFAAFPEDEEISVQKLKWLWIAEGFVQSTKGDSLEDVAEEYFTNLVSRSLVTPTKKTSLGGAKECHVHDLLHHFSLEKAKEERFLQVKHVDDELRPYLVCDHRRLSIRTKRSDPCHSWPLGYCVRTLIHTATDIFPLTELAEDVATSILSKFKLLTVLDLSFIEFSEFFKGIELFIHLRLLAIRTEETSIPSSIGKLWNLQVLYVDTDLPSFRPIKVPSCLWDIVKLRNVHINHSAHFKVGSRTSLGPSLETLSTPRFYSKEEAEELLARLPELRRLKCILSYCGDCPRFKSFLKQLVSLRVFSGDMNNKRYIFESTFPSSLQKLTLANFGLAWDNISKVVGTLPNLQSLKLMGDDWGNTWPVDVKASPEEDEGSSSSSSEEEDDEAKPFPKLKYLSMKLLVYLREWTADEGSFPILEQLVLEECTQLQEIPLWFGGISKLRLIKVRGCQASVDDSAREIQQIHKDEWGNEQLKLIIDPQAH